MTTITLPQDDAFLTDQLVQWWYWTGHITIENGKRFGFELCFFAVDAQAMHLFETIAHEIHGAHIPSSLTTVQMMNAAITDIDNQKFYSRIEYKPGAPTPPKEGVYEFDLHNLPSFGDVHGDCHATGGGGVDHLRSKVDKFSFDLQLKQERPPVIHYNGEKNNYSFGGYTYYYSREIMSASGSFIIDGEKHNITEGSIWFDRQYGELLQAVFLIGWQWFAIQLSDNTQIMLFDYHCEKDHMGSITNSEGTTTNLGPDDFTVTILDWWTSPNTSRVYPSKWHIKAGEYDLIIRPQVADQELSERFLFPKYWEGACTVEGNHEGSAYVELTCYPRHKWLKSSGAEQLA